MRALGLYEPIIVRRLARLANRDPNKAVIPSQSHKSTLIMMLYL